MLLIQKLKIDHELFHVIQTSDAKIFVICVQNINFINLKIKKYIKYI